MKKLRLREVKWLLNGNTAGLGISSALAIGFCSVSHLTLFPLLCVTGREQNMISLILGLQLSLLTSNNFWAIK